MENVHEREAWFCIYERIILAMVIYQWQDPIIYIYMDDTKRIVNMMQVFSWIE